MNEKELLEKLREIEGDSDEARNKAAARVLSHLSGLIDFLNEGRDWLDLTDAQKDAEIATYARACVAAFDKFTQEIYK